MKRVLICGLHQESNTFNPQLADYSFFDIYESGSINYENKDLPLIYKGIFEALNDFRAESSENNVHIETIGGTVFYASSGGPVDHCVIKDFINTVKRSVKKAGKIDGVVIALHGATISDKSDDVCGDIIETVRKVVGTEAYISSAFDLHANITEKIMRNCDFISGYQKYPHLDIRETGYRAAKRIIESFNGQIMNTARVAIPQMAPAHAYSTNTPALAKLMNKAQELKAKNIIVDYNIFQVQPWLDIKDISSTVVICAQSKDVAEKVAADLAEDEFSIRKDLLGEKLFSVEEVIQKALENKTGKPVVLVDAADSPNAGACGDSAYVLEKLLPYKDCLRAAVGLIDRPAVEMAHKLGVGNTAEFTLGATIAPKLSNPITVKATVKSLHDGYYRNCGPQEHGEESCIGRTAVLKIGNILLHIIEKGRMGDPAFYRSFGIDPEFCQFISVKACTSFRAAYKSIASNIYNADTPGAAGCVLTKMNYKNIPRPFYPFDEITVDSVSYARCYKEQKMR